MSGVPDSSLHPRITARRRNGTWTYGDHEGLNPGWRFKDTNLVLDYDPLDSSCYPLGCYNLWRDGQQIEPVAHYLDCAMDFVERTHG